MAAVVVEVGQVEPIVTIAPKEFVRNPFAPKAKAIHGAKAERDRTAWGKDHTVCMVCGAGEWANLTTHEIIGGRGGRSLEPCNYFRACWKPCHADFADHSKNLGIVLSMKLRAGELSQADLDRLGELHGKRLPDLAEIPQRFVVSYEMNARMRRAA